MPQVSHPNSPIGMVCILENVILVEEQLRWTSASTKHLEPSTPLSKLQHGAFQVLICAGSHQNVQSPPASDN